MKEGLIFILFLLAFSSIFDTINQLFLKSAINSLRLTSPVTIIKVIRFIIRLILVPRVWLSFLFSVLSLATYLFVLWKVDLSFAFSVDSMHYIFIAIGSKLILKERVGFRRWAGTIFIIIGIILVTIS